MATTRSGHRTKVAVAAVGLTATSLMGGFVLDGAWAADGSTSVVTDQKTDAPVVDQDSGDEVQFPESTKITAAEFTEARKEDRATPDTAEEKDLKAEFLENAAEMTGAYYLPSEVEVGSLSDDLSIVGAKDLVVKDITVAADEAAGSVSATADVDPGKTDASAPSAGFAAWSVEGSGSYSLKVTGWGSGLFTWSKWKLTGGDGDSAKDYWTYKRKASGDPASWDNAIDPIVTVLYIRNYPNTATYSILKNWVDWAAAGTQDSCSDNTTYLEVAFGPVTAGMNFAGCLSADFGKNSDIPGEARSQITQGGLLGGAHGGTIETGYMTTFAVEQGKTPVFNDQQKITFWQSSRSRACSNTNASATCTP